MFQGYKLCLATLLLTIAIARINANVISPGSLVRSADQNLMQFMVRSSALSRENPTRSLGCFDYYVPVLNGITAEYERSYAACLTVADESREVIDQSTQPQRDEIESSAQDACSALSACNENSNSVSYFQCYVDAGSANSKVMYSISANSSVILAEIREQYRLIENAQNRCTNASERAYVENTTSAYEELQACLQGRIPVPTTTTEIPTSSPTPTTSSAAPEPESSTTEEPSSSAATEPESSTTEDPEEPSVSSEAPEEA